MGSERDPINRNRHAQCPSRSKHPLTGRNAKQLKAKVNLGWMKGMLRLPFRAVRKRSRSSHSSRHCSYLCPALKGLS
jgi:hypothetical protein